MIKFYYYRDKIISKYRISSIHLKIFLQKVKKHFKNMKLKR